MREAATHFIGEKNFSSFMAADSDANHPVSEITSVEIFEKEEGLIEIEVRGTAFLRHMVRIMVGTLAAVGKGKMSVGASEGIGKVAARRFLAEGARLAICARRPEALAAACAELRAAGGEVLAVAADASLTGEMERFVAATVERYGRIDVLVNNAGVLRDGQLIKFKEGQLVGQMSEAGFDLVISINLKGVFNCTQAAAPVMAKQGGGVILNATSVVGLDGNFGQTNYVATKSGVIGMTKVWARELGRFGIRVNAVAPGFTATGGEQQNERRSLYGMAGRFRPTKYGVEYRTPSNAWLYDETLRDYLGTAGTILSALLSSPQTAQVRLYNEVPWNDVRATINAENRAEARALLRWLGNAYPDLGFQNVA